MLLHTCSRAHAAKVKCEWMPQIFFVLRSSTASVGLPPRCHHLGDLALYECCPPLPCSGGQQFARLAAADMTVKFVVEGVCTYLRFAKPV